MTPDDLVERVVQQVRRKGDFLSWYRLRKYHSFFPEGAPAADPEAAADNDIRQIAQAALQALSDAGMVVVPREPTPAMLNAAALYWGAPGCTLKGAYRAMINTYTQGTETR